MVSALEQSFEDHCRDQFLPPPLTQLTGLIPGRKFVYDFGWLLHTLHSASADVQCYLLVEVQGGVWAKGASGHSSGKGIVRDATKFNLATMRGHRVLICPSNMIWSGDIFVVIRTILSDEGVL